MRFVEDLYTAQLTYGALENGGEGTRSGPQDDLGHNFQEGVSLVTPYASFDLVPKIRRCRAQAMHVQNYDLRIHLRGVCSMLSLSHFWCTYISTIAPTLDLSLQMALTSKTCTVALSDGNTMFAFGLGVYESADNGETEQAVLWALKHGYRHIDTASFYK